MTHTSGERQILPGNVKSTNYTLRLEPDLIRCDTNGTVTIELDVVEDSFEISLNALETEILDVKLMRLENIVERPRVIRQDEESQVLTIVFDKQLESGSKLALTIDFKSQLTDKSSGFFRISYTENSVTKYLAATQMEPVDARRVFPCFDEPALKATFDVTLIAEKTLTCLSNMNVTSETEVSGGKKSVVFARSPLMSTYLIAFVIGELDYIESNAFHVPIRVYTTPGITANGQYALDLAAKTLKFYEEAFDCPFPLPKLDMVGIPEMGGAMENWGLVIYRNNFLLYEENKSGALQKTTVANVVQHELAHQWFGNIVTMDFWDGLWLNEGFATWMSQYSSNIFNPDWHIWQQFVGNDMQTALELDSLRSSHPIEVPVVKASEINQIFDDISYKKGSAVINMIAKYLGEDIFLNGIKVYLKKHAYGNTDTSDLWAALSEVSGREVGKIMSIWTKKVGFPIVTVKETASGIFLEQNRFLRTFDATPAEDETLYPIFLAVSTEVGVQKDYLLETRSMEIPLKDLDFFKLNTNHTGIYRTLYTPARLKKLGGAANSGLLSVEDRIGLIADASALASSGYQKTSAVLELLDGMGNETNTLVWKQILTCLDNVQEAWKFEGKTVNEALAAFVRKLVTPRVRKLGWEFSNEDDMMLVQQKVLMVKNAGLAGDTTITTAAATMFASFTAGQRSAIDPNIRSAVYAIALKSGGSKDFEGLLATYHELQNQDEKDDVLRGLGYTQDPACVQKVLAMLLAPEIKLIAMFALVSGIRISHAQPLWSWLKENWEAICAKLGTSLGVLGGAVEMIVHSLGNPEQLEDVQEFFGSKDTTGIENGLAQGIDALKAKIAWVQRDAADVETWLVGEGYMAR